VSGIIFGFFFDEPPHSDGWAFFPKFAINGKAFLFGNLVAWAVVTYFCLSWRAKRQTQANDVKADSLAARGPDE
jgi:hypothetical protein